MNHPTALGLSTDLPANRQLRLSGSPYEIGLQHGRQMQSAIHAFLGNGMASTASLVNDPSRLDGFAERIRLHADIIECCMPTLAQEVHGLAAGADISLEQAYLLQLRRELVGYSSVRSQGDCTTFGRLHDDSTSVIGQTVDLAGSVADELTVLDIAHQRHGRQVMLLTFTGLIGYLGMNDSGVAIGLNLVLGGEWRPGIPGYLAIRHLLDEADSVDTCLSLLRRLPLASSRSLMITDGKRLVTVEHILDDMRLLENRSLVHANHFLHPDFQPRDELNFFAKGSSVRRLQACQQRLASIHAGAPAEAYLAMLNEPPIEVPPNADVRRECTVASALMCPATGQMHIKKRLPHSGHAALH